jgi:hypothetical protein
MKCLSNQDFWGGGALIYDTCFQNSMCRDKLFKPWWSGTQRVSSPALTYYLSTINTTQIPHQLKHISVQPTSWWWLWHVFLHMSVSKYFLFSNMYCFRGDSSCCVWGFDADDKSCSATLPQLEHSSSCDLYKSNMEFSCITLIFIIFFRKFGHGTIQCRKSYNHPATKTTYLRASICRSSGV